MDHSKRGAPAKELALRAADHLMGRWRASGQYIQAWGVVGDAASGGRIIIDCMMNLPLLYWVSEQTGDPSYRQAAEIHAEKSRRFLVRGDDSSYHTFHFDQDTGVPIGGTTHQGYTNGSTWSRGQAWGIHGFALSYRYTLNPDFLKTSKRLVAYFLNHLPQDHVAYWDFDAPQTENLFRDSSAAAIAAAGILELLDHMNPQDPDIPFFQEGLKRSMLSLVNNYSTMNEPDAEGLLNHGSYHVRGNVSPDDFMIWGDYFYLESLIRIQTGMAGYWYERK
jgi:unsaturated chondroitin disaccharide hydrolase